MLTLLVRAQSAWHRSPCLALRYLRRTDGATAIEYGLIAAGVAVAIIAAIFALGDTLSNFFNDIGNNIAAAS